MSIITPYGKHHRSDDNNQKHLYTHKKFSVFLIKIAKRRDVLVNVFHE
jgi:hypothetical protein